MLCVLIVFMNVGGWVLQFEIDFKWQIFWETFHSNFVYYQNICMQTAAKWSIPFCLRYLSQVLNHGSHYLPTRPRRLLNMNDELHIWCKWTDGQARAGFVFYKWFTVYFVLFEVSELSFEPRLPLSIYWTAGTSEY